jgi:Leucine-rich repeat (LRR) protein
VPNLLYLNLSYNTISRIEGLECLRSLIELNLAENAIEIIENLGSLTSLERLNLSGNFVKRIPATIASLQKLTELRLARNELHVLEDIANLIPLTRLSNLRIDENPLCQDALTAPFAIYSLEYLRILNGHTVTEDDREESRMRFASHDREHLRSQVCHVMS